MDGYRSAVREGLEAAVVVTGSGTLDEDSVKAVRDLTANGPVFRATQTGEIAEVI
ncbi:hypothetical protein [Lentzea indica]|jgi:hypothetical protein|uniref:hypothetical protein n=1 Tax=Lentzea indica TaxID=2604800 RepID=UPI0014387E6C|nr:hypothetical protein [Lentzea indica]